MGLRRAPIKVAIDELELGGVKPSDPRVARAVEQATRQALAGRPAARHADPAAIGRAVSSAASRRTR